MIFFVVLGVFTSCKSMAQDVVDHLILNKQYNEALVKVNKFLAENPTARLFNQKGIILREKFDYLGSLSAFNQAVILEQNNINYLSDLAESMAAIGNTSDAVDVYKKALLLNPNAVSLRMRLGQLYILQRDFAESFSLFNKLRDLDSTNLFVNKNLAFSASRLGKNKEAIYLFEQVLKVNPRDIGSYMALAAAYQQERLFTRSNLVLESGLKHYPNNSVLLLRLAQNFYTQQDFEKALPVYEAWVSNNSLYFDVRKEYGIVLYLNKMEEKALDVLEYALFENPADPFVALYIGLCYKRLKDYPVSLQYLHLAIESATPYYLSEIYHHMGQVHGQLREFESSIKMLQKAYELDPGKFELLFEIATTLEEYNSNKTLALNYYQIYLTEAREQALNADYALNRIRKLKEELFFE
jgi:tetratricopeptide (TPR) repeat protein